MKAKRLETNKQKYKEISKDEIIEKLTELECIAIPFAEFFAGMTSEKTDLVYFSSKLWPLIDPIEEMAVGCNSDWNDLIPLDDMTSSALHSIDYELSYSLNINDPSLLDDSIDILTMRGTCDGGTVGFETFINMYEARQLVTWMKDNA